MMSQFRHLVFWLLVVAWTSPPASGTDTSLPGQDYPQSTISLVYPTDVDELDLSIFKSIISGIQTQVGARLRIFPLGSSTDLAALNKRLKADRSGAIIALGRTGVEVAFGMDSNNPIIVSGIFNLSDADNHRIAGISLMTDPAVLFNRLKNLVPGIKKISVAYNPKENERLIKSAREAAQLNGIELVTHAADNLGSAAHFYLNAIEKADFSHDAIWLPQDSTTVDDESIIPLVLKNAWASKLVVFSSRVPDVRKGALFAPIPDNDNLGRNLGNLALRAVTGKTINSGLTLLRDARIVVNARTASHLGIAVRQRDGVVITEPQKYDRPSAY